MAAIRHSMPHATVLIADDHPAMLERLVNLLKDRFDVVGTAANGYLLIEAAARLRPDVIVTDVSMPGLNGLKALRQLKAAHPDTKVIVLTLDDDAELAAHAIRSGASGFVTKFSVISDLATAIHEVLQGRIYSTRAGGDAFLPDGR